MLRNSSKRNQSCGVVRRSQAPLGFVSKLSPKERYTRGRVRGSVRIFPQGRMDARVAYVERGEGVFVLELVRHGTNYDRLNDQLNEGKLSEADYPFASLQPWISC